MKEMVHKVTLKVAQLAPLVGGVPEDKKPAAMWDVHF